MLPHDEEGEGAPVVLLHAGVADRTMWGEHLRPLADAGYRGVPMDLPGFGQAPPAEAPWSEVLETLDGLGIHRAAIVGNSFGGAVAYNLAVVAPERVTALVLVSAPAPDLDPSGELAAVWEAEESALERGEIEAAVRAVVDTWTLPDASQVLRDRVADMQRRAFELRAEAEAPTEQPAPAEEDPDLLDELDVPVLVISGERDMPDFLLAAESLAWRLGAATPTVLPGAGHLAPLEQPAEFDRLLIRFLDQQVSSS